MKEFDQFSYGISIRDISDGANDLLLSDQRVSETGSSIKAPIGTLALLETVAEGVNPHTYGYTVGPTHYSNGSGDLKDKNYDFDGAVMSDKRAENGTLKASIGYLTTLNIVESDCIATNALIDFIGDKDVINDRLQSVLGMEATTLVTNRLHFPGVNHLEVPYQVATTTMDDMTSFYKRLHEGSIGLPQTLHDDYWNDLSQVEKTPLLGGTQADVPAHISWKHKTGSIIDDKRDDPQAPYYVTLVDAGVLETEGRTLAVAAATTVYRDVRGDNPNMTDLVRIDFATRNQEILADYGVEVDKLPLAIAA